MECTCCGNQADVGKKLCRSCASKKNVSLRESRKRNRENGLCIYCSSPTVNGRLCTKCLETKKAASRAYRKSKKDSGICINCGNKAVIGRRCGECAQKHKQWATDRYRNRDTRQVCVRCGKADQAVGNRCLECAKDHNARTKQRDLNRKLAAFDAYGGAKCACCGETVVQFLTIDHMNNDGAEHRKELSKHRKHKKGGGGTMYSWLKKNNYPSGFQVLCFNCNVGRYINGGICPHKQVPAEP